MALRYCEPRSLPWAVARTESARQQVARNKQEPSRHTIQLGRVVCPEEELDELGVRDLCRVKLDAAGFGVRGRPAADLAVGWRVDLAALGRASTGAFSGVIDQ